MTAADRGGPRPDHSTAVLGATAADRGGPHVVGPPAAVARRGQQVHHTDGHRRYLGPMPAWPEVWPTPPARVADDPGGPTPQPTRGASSGIAPVLCVEEFEEDGPDPTSPAQRPAGGSTGPRGGSPSAPDSRPMGLSACQSVREMRSGNPGPISDPLSAPDGPPSAR